MRRDLLGLDGAGARLWNLLQTPRSFKSRVVE